MKANKKIIALLCAVALVIAGIAYAPSGVKANDYSGLLTRISEITKIRSSIRN